LDRYAGCNQFFDVIFSALWAHFQISNLERFWGLFLEYTFISNYSFY